jgi:flagellar basal body rod protein FlgB
LVIFGEHQIKHFEDLILLNHNIEINNNGNYWIIKNLNEEALLELIGISRLRLNVISNNIANVNTENYLRKYLKITKENGIEIVNDARGVDLDEETVYMFETQLLFEISTEYLKRINENIIIM